MVRIWIKTRTGEAYAEGEYKENSVVVKAGGRICIHFADYIQGGTKAKSYRNNSEYVDKNGYILKDCEFTSPSTAAQFVTGRSVNGYEIWKVDKKKNLDKYLKEKGLR